MHACGECLKDLACRYHQWWCSLMFGFEILCVMVHIPSVIAQDNRLSVWRTSAGGSDCSSGQDPDRGLSWRLQVTHRYGHICSIPLGCAWSFHYLNSSAACLSGLCSMNLSSERTSIHTAACTFGSDQRAYDLWWCCYTQLPWDNSASSQHRAHAVTVRHSPCCHRVLYSAFG